MVGVEIIKGCREGLWANIHLVFFRSAVFRGALGGQRGPPTTCSPSRSLERRGEGWLGQTGVVDSGRGWAALS